MSLFVLLGLHQVSEGHVGVYWRGGALLPTISDPGFHVKIPVLTRFSEVQTTVQTDSVHSIPCGTSGGVMITFDKVEVVNRLRKEAVHDTIKNYTVNYDKTWIFDKFCSSHTLEEVYITLFDKLDEHLTKTLQNDCNIWAPGIEVITVRITKPHVPEMIKKNYELMEAEKTKLKISIEAQKVLEKEAETRRKQATIEAQMFADVSKIEYTKKVMEMESMQQMEAIQDSIHLSKVKSAADAMYYQKSQEALANAKLLTPEYLQYLASMMMANISKIYFGEKIPSVLIDPSLFTTQKTNLNEIHHVSEMKDQGQCTIVNGINTCS
eukprot:gene2017-3916_t